MSCSIIIPINPVLSIQFLTIILIRLNTPRSSKQSAEWVIIISFFHITVLICYHTDISLMIFQIKMKLLIRETYITSLIQQHLQRAVLIDRIATVICYRSNTVYYMSCTKFSTIRPVLIFNHVTVDKNYLTWQI